MVTDSIGTKIKKLRDNFGMSCKQASVLIGEISHSTWGYWEHHGAPVERLQQISKLMNNNDEVFDWLTGNGKMPILDLMYEIPPGGNGKKKSPKKDTKKKDKVLYASRDGKQKVTRRKFTDQEMANLVHEVARLQSDAVGMNFGEACNRVNVGTTAIRRWQQNDDLPEPNFAPTTGVNRNAQLEEIQAKRDAVMGPDTTTGPRDVEEAAQNITNGLPQQPRPPAPSRAKPRRQYSQATTRTKVAKPRALIVAAFLCPHCGQAVQLPED